MLVNFSNHPSDRWSSTQKTAASVYGDIIDISFPVVSTSATTDEISAIADDCVERILCVNPCAVMCQGEFTLSFAVISRLKSRSIKVIAACSERKSIEIEDNGITQKTVIFKFHQFREYIS